MGEPVNILELAQRMIRLKGYSLKDEQNPDGDIAIEITGLQPGENLHEKLLIGEKTTGTRHRKIMRATESYLPWGELREVLSTLEQSCDQYDYEGIRAFLDELLAGPDMASRLAEIRKPADVVPLKPVDSGD